MKPKITPFQQRGTTLIESMAAIVVIAMVLMSIVIYYGAAERSLKAEADRAKAAYIASSLLEEMHMRRWDETPDTGSAIGLDAGEVSGSKITFDDVDDFNGYSEAAIQYPDGTPVPAYSMFGRSVTVEYVLDNLTTVMSTPTRRKRVTVTVTRNGKQVLTIRTAFAKDV